MENTENKYISLEEFMSKYDRISEKTIRKNLSKIPGAKVTDNNIIFLEGSRYFFNVRNAKLNDSAKRRYILLKAISQYRYIDHKALKMEHSDFINMLGQMIGEGWIEENNGYNQYGANKYNITSYGETVLFEAKSKHMITLAKIAGTFTGSVLSQIFDAA